MRRIRKANITFISLVPAGANKIQPVYKDDGSVLFGTVVKASDTFDEKGELTAVVYAPEHRDSQGDIADAEVVKQACYDFIANGGKVDIRHDGKAVSAEQARVGETFLVQKSDARFHGWKDRDGQALDLTGAWATIIKIDDPELRKKYRSGEWAGVSMGGTAIVEQEKSDLEHLLKAILKAVNPPKTKTEEETVDETKILKAITDGFAELTKALQPKPPETPKTPEAPKEEQAPVFKGNWEDERAVTKHARAMQLFQLRKGTDQGSPESLLAYREAIAVLKQEWAAEDEAAGIVETPTPVRKAGPSNGANPTQSSGLTHLSKADQDLIEAGRLAGQAYTNRNKPAVTAGAR